jgi:hypothetical protein
MGCSVSYCRFRLEYEHAHTSLHLCSLSLGLHIALQPGAQDEVQWHSNGLALEGDLQRSKAGQRLEGKEHEHPGVGKDNPTDLSLKSGMDASNGTIENEGVSRTFVGEQNGQPSRRQNEPHENRKKQLPRAGSPSSKESNYSQTQLKICKLAAYGLFALAALQAGIATVGNLVSLCLVGWDNASLTFYEFLATKPMPM